MTEINDLPTPSDPRSPYAVVTSAVRELMDHVTPDQLGNPTPCPEFDVKYLLEHLVELQRRSAAIGRGEPWASVQIEAQDSGWAESFGEASHEVMLAWTDDAKLGQEFEVPWGTFPGSGILIAFTGELATHGWDLAQAAGLEYSIPDDVLGDVLIGAKFVPAEGRDVEGFPFGPVVDPGSDAPVLDQIAGWFGRDVIASAAAA